MLLSPVNDSGEDGGENSRPFNILVKQSISPQTTKLIFSEAETPTGQHSGASLQLQNTAVYNPTSHVATLAQQINANQVLYSLNAMHGSSPTTMHPFAHQMAQQQ